MFQPLPIFPPLYPPGEWWRLFLSHRLAGNTEDEAIRAANAAANVKPRGWMRITVEADSVLSLPVAGGASALKNRHPDSWVIATESIREGRKIINTLSTLYGNRPFYHILAPHLTEIFTSDAGIRASAIALEAFSNVVRILSLDNDTLLKDIRLRIAAGDRLLKETGMEFETKSSLHLSILDSIFTLGPDAIFAILPAF